MPAPAFLKAAWVTYDSKRCLTVKRFTAMAFLSLCTPQGMYWARHKCGLNTGVRFGWRRVTTNWMPMARVRPLSRCHATPLLLSQRSASPSTAGPANKPCLLTLTNGGVPTLLQAVLQSCFAMLLAKLSAYWRALMRVLAPSLFMEPSNL